MDHQQQQHNNNNGAYTDGTSGDDLQQYSQGFNASDNLYPNLNDHSDASWGVNTSAFPQPDLSRAYHQSTDWASQQQQQHPDSLSGQHNNAQNNAFRRSPLPTGSTFSPAPSFNNYSNPAAYNYQQPQYDPSLLASTNQAFKQYQSSYTGHNAESRTIEPQALEQQQRSEIPSAAALSRASNLVDQVALANAVPAGREAGIFNVIDYDRLVRATNSERMSAFATIARESQEWDVNRAALPMYVPRNSKSALKRLAGGDGMLLAKINQKSVKKPRLAKPTMSRRMKSLGEMASAIKQDQHTEESSEEDDSEYTTESDIEDSPLPTKRPQTPKEAIEYDTTKALWRSKRKAVDANEVRKGLVDFWEVVKTVRDRWKTDAAAVVQAEEKKLKGELPLLRQRVKDQRDMIECAFKAALKHGNRTILETLSENLSLLFLCYQFLLDRHKADDMNGTLARSILEVMVLFNTLNNDKLEKTHLIKVLPRYIKSGDAKTQFYAKSITSRAAGNKSTAGTDKPAPTKTPASKIEPTTSVKRPASSTDASPVAKKPATATTKSAASVPPPGNAKKRLLGDDAVKPVAKKPATSNAVTSKSADATSAKPNPAPSKLRTGLFAGLQSAAKKPGTSVKPATAANGVKSATTSAASSVPAKSVFSFAETMRNLTQPKEEKPAPKVVEKEVPDETPVQKARRLRREARGPLRVHWKSNEDLVAVREFTHDPDEETGHDSSQTRDVADLQGEGRMFKQQHNKILEEDDDEAAVEVPVKMIDWYEPTAVDFTDVPKEERDRNYYPFGGGQTQAESAENAERQKYESNTLTVFYSHSDDIPATPREPEDPITGEAKSPTAFGAPEQQYIDRAAQKSAAHRGNLQHNGAQPINFDMLRNALGGQQQAATQFQAPSMIPAAAQPTLDIQAILKQLGQNAPAQSYAQPAPFMSQPAFNAAPLPGAFFPPVSQPVALPAAQPDITAILAQLNGSTQPTQPPPAYGLPPPGANDPGFMAFLARRMQESQQQQQQ